MADSNPFAHLGQGMIGADVGIAKAAGTPQPIFQKNPMAGLLAMGLDKMGVKDFLNSLSGGADQNAENGVAPASVGGVGINPMGVGVMPPGSDVAGIGLQNKTSVGGIQPRPYTAAGFGAQPALPKSPYQTNQPEQAGDTHNQIRSAWGV